MLRGWVQGLQPFFGQPIRAYDATTIHELIVTKLARRTMDDGLFLVERAQWSGVLTAAVLVFLTLNTPFSLIFLFPLLFFS